MKTVRILIADDHEVVREGLRAVIEKEPDWEVCDTAQTGREAVEKAGELKPDIVVLDMGMPELNGLEATRQIKRLLPKTEVLIFTAQETDDLVREVFDAGAKSFILKAEANRYLVEAIKALSEHKPFFTSKVSEIIFARFLHRSERSVNSQTSDERLTSRERETVQLIAEGKSNKEIAEIFGISVKTVETHRAAIMRKLDLDCIAALVRYAIRNGIIEA